MPTRTITTRFYPFDQNNSGGCYENDESAGIGEVVWIEAPDIHAANARAEQIGLYFNGCSSGRDCECCGDRWSEAWSDREAVEDPATEHGQTSRLVFVHPFDGPFYRLDAASPRSEPRPAGRAGVGR